jgi:hypothetical protein
MIEILRRQFAPALTFAVALLLVVFASARVATADKLKAEDVIAKHLEALGPAASRTSDRSRVVVGTARAVFKASRGSGAIDGRAVFGSVQNKVLVAMAFTAPNYPGDKFGFDGKKLTIAYQTPGVRSTLGHFLLTNSSIVKEGLMGGTLSSAWPLLNLAERGAKVSYSGTEKIDGRAVHKLNYSPNKGSDVKISLYFDSETFHHIRTQYELVISSRIAAGGVDNQAGQRETRYKMVEKFTDYKKEGELNLPHSYALEFEIVKTNGSSSDKWEIKLEQFAFNQEIDSKSFNVEGD